MTGMPRTRSQKLLGGFFVTMGVAHFLAPARMPLQPRAMWWVHRAPPSS